MEEVGVTHDRVRDSAGSSNGVDVGRVRHPNLHRRKHTRFHQVRPGEQVGLVYTVDGRRAEDWI